jgi:ABC-type dipeptide/oligopeptide/nickel transport system permease component
MPLLLLGLLLMAATAAFVGLVIGYNTGGGPDYSVNLIGNHPFTMSMLGAFASGLALATIFGLGLWLMLGGGMLARRRSRKRHAARHGARQVAAQRDAMASRLQESGHEEHIPREPGQREHAGATSYEKARRPPMTFHRPHLRGH